MPQKRTPIAGLLLCPSWSLHFGTLGGPVLAGAPTRLSSAGNDCQGAQNSQSLRYLKISPFVTPSCPFYTFWDMYVYVGMGYVRDVLGVARTAHLKNAWQAA